ncbi:hypothetical protein CTAYLR_000732 [Chrysophaeum taylorii]|uniref:YHYH domain-containing protein n=1 Tax=Chrysophaeum taylorii TaxID=2483200 RepID=A0AAD7UB35_9STRA|nr:hypothetical protein CTAYLR_000732 [Chrysophaeum taylorii]
MRLLWLSFFCVACAHGCPCGKYELCVRGRCVEAFKPSTSTGSLSIECFAAWPNLTDCARWSVRGDFKVLESNGVPPFSVAPYCPFGLGEGYCESPAFGGNSTDCAPFLGMSCPCTGGESCPNPTPYGDVIQPVYQRFEFPRRPDPTTGVVRHMYNNSVLKTGNSYQVIGAHLSGVQLKGPAEANGYNVDTSLIPLFCGGHVTPPVGPGPVYHFHKAADCLDIATPGRHGPLVGFAADGFGIYGFGDTVGEPVLDECHGHFGDTPDGFAYHYHASAVHNRGGTMAFQPYYLGCLGPSLGKCNSTITADYDGGADWCGPGCGADVCIQTGSNRSTLLAYISIFQQDPIAWLSAYSTNAFE